MPGVIGGTTPVSRLSWSGPDRTLQPMPNAADTASPAVTTTTRYLYDGWNLLAEVSTAGSAVRSYTWGLDLSGSSQGAGGVGGLLALTDSAGNAVHFAAYDGNGNISGLVRADAGTLSASYDYNAFGETMLAEGAFADGNPFRFSTKYTDSETGLLYYGFRYYQPQTGRWLNRDPINDRGSQITRSVLPEGDLQEESNLFAFVRNDPLGRFDPWGLAYFALRPLQGSPWLYGYSKNPISDFFNVEISHETVFFEDGKLPANLGFFYDTNGGEVRSDSLDGYRKTDGGWNDCLMRTATANVPARPYCLLGKGPNKKFNCQDWADAVRAEYRRLVKSGQTSCCLTNAEKRK